MRDFLYKINSIWQFTFKAQTIWSALAKRGIYSIDFSIVIKPLPKSLPDVPILEEYTGNKPPPSSSIANPPPITVRKLQYSINKAQEA